MLLCTHPYSNISLHSIKKSQKSPLKGGKYCSHHNRAFRPNSACIPIQISPKTKDTFYLKTYNFETESQNPFQLVLKSYDQEYIDRQIQISNSASKYLFFSWFSGIILFLGLLFFIPILQFKRFIFPLFMPLIYLLP